MPVNRRGEALGTRIFRALLACYPGAFRDEYGRELALVFVDRYRDAAGWWDRVRLWAGAIGGILAEAPKEHARMLRQDLRYACRLLGEQAVVTATIVVTLGLGIGANTAVFSLLNAIALRSSLPLPDPDQLYTVNGGSYAIAGPESARFSGPMFDVLRRSAPDGVGVAAMSRGIARVYTRTEGERETSPASLQLVSPDFFSVLGVSPVLGRTLPNEEDPLHGAPVAVISHAYRHRRFEGSPGVVGRTLTINGTAFTIVGIGPPEFAGVWLESPVDVWVPLTMQQPVKYAESFSADDAQLDRPWLPQARIWWLYVVVRVPAGQMAAAAGAFNASLSAIAGRDPGIVLQPFARGFSRFRQQFSTPLVALMVMAALVLLIACANVANLLMARAVGRQREMAVRMALGAGRARLVHQLLAESALLVVMAGVAALLFARWAGNLLVRIATSTTDGLLPFTAPIDVRVLAFTAGVAFVSVVIFGLLPAWRATRVDVVGALKTGSRGAISGGMTPARVLVVLQVALSLVLVTGTALFVRSFQNLIHVDPGIERDRLLTADIDPRLSGVPPQDLPELYRRLLDAVRAVPGVRSASLAMCGLQSSCARMDFSVEGYRPQSGERVVFSVNAVSPDYFSTLGTPLVAGRVLSERDVANAPAVAVVNRTLAATYLGGWRRAIGRRVGADTPDVEVVGVVEDARALGNLDEAAMPTVFVPLAQWSSVVPRSMEVRTLADPASTIGAVRRAIRNAAPELPVERVVTIDEQVRHGLGRERLLMLLTSAFGALALGLAGLGLFGVLSYAVARRTAELGLRIALGASPARVVWSIVRDALWLVLCGVALGMPAVLLGGRLVSSLIFGLSTHDAATLAGASVVLAAVGAACSIVPARRAARVDPVAALSQE